MPPTKKNKLPKPVSKVPKPVSLPPDEKDDKEVEISVEVDDKPPKPKPDPKKKTKPPKPTPISGKKSNRVPTVKTETKIEDKGVGLNKPSMRRLARRAGVKRIKGDVYEKSIDMCRKFVTELLTKAHNYTEHARRKTITSVDVLYGAKSLGRTLFAA